MISTTYKLILDKNSVNDDYYKTELICGEVDLCISKTSEIWINYEYLMYLKILKEKDNIEKINEYLSIYEFDKPCLVNNFDEAFNNLCSFKNNIFGIIISNFEKTDLEILIGGSSSLASVVKDEYKFEPNDIDIYVKNIDNEKIIKINEILHTIFYDCIVYIVRRPLTITWWIFDEFENIILLIQLNILLINSWTDVFLVYHSDLLCIGYEIQTKKFITLKYRLDFIKSFDEPIFFTNIFNIDNVEQILNASNKYGKRNFKTILITEKPKNTFNTLCISGNDRDEIFKYGNIINSFKIYYENCFDIIIDKNILNVINEIKNIPRMIDIKYFTDDYQNLIKSIEELQINEYKNGKYECPIMLENINIVVENNHCSHFVSLYVFIKQNIVKCPLCRKKWSHINCYVNN